MGIGSGTGKDKAEIAAKAAISSPLLETSISGAMGVIISISASPDIGLEDVDVAAGMVRAECSEDANIIFGVGFDENLSDEMRITIVATGFTKDGEQAPAAPKAAYGAKAEAPKAKASIDDFLDGLL
jgi:cell division protein FtsZ